MIYSGSRVQKYWFKVCHSEEKRDMILTRVCYSSTFPKIINLCDTHTHTHTQSPVSEKCKLSLGESDVDKSHVHTLNTMMTTLQVSIVIFLFLLIMSKMMITCIRYLMVTCNLCTRFYQTQVIKISSSLFNH